MNNKVPCGGFVAGAGLKVEDGRVNVRGGVDTWIWCEMTEQNKPDNTDFGFCYIRAIHVMDADFNELWSLTPETPSKTAGLKECINWLAENNKVDNLGFGRMMVPGANPNYEPWFIAKVVDYEETTRYMKGYYFISMRPSSIIESEKTSGYFQNEYQVYFAKPRSTMKWQYQGVTESSYLYSKFTPSTT